MMSLSFFNSSKSHMIEASFLPSFAFGCWPCVFPYVGPDYEWK
jgi:hypothetical protein